jgi:hypothetical protein
MGDRTESNDEVATAPSQQIPSETNAPLNQNPTTLPKSSNVANNTSIMSSILSDSVYKPEGWNIKDILRSNSSAISEQISSYSNLGRSLIGSTIGFDDSNYDYYDADRDMEWEEPWVEVDISDFRTRVAGSPDNIEVESRYFDKTTEVQLLIGEQVLETVSAYSMGNWDHVEGPVLGTLFLTNYRLVFYAENMQWDIPKYSIGQVSNCPPLKTGPKFFITLEINTKTFLNFQLGFTFDVSNYKIYNELTAPTLERMQMMNILMDYAVNEESSNNNGNNSRYNSTIYGEIGGKADNGSLRSNHNSSKINSLITDDNEQKNKNCMATKSNNGINNCFAFHFKPMITQQQQEKLSNTSNKMAHGVFNRKNNKNISHGHLSPGWANFDLDDEYRRLGLLKKIGATANDVLGSLAGTVLFPWRLTDANKQFELCATYPTKFIVPRNISDESLKRIASFRSKGRLPAVVYRHPANNATISRCAQPMVGLVRRARCPDDEKYIKQLIPDAKEKKDVYIIDCRSQAAAYGNLAVGRGFEFSANYGGSKLLFMNIENIHAMRESCKRIVELGVTAWRSCGEGDTRWWSHLEATRWLEHIRSLLAAASMCARIVTDGHSILIHCSDGWDRTPQLSSLAQILVDPYYRTIRGFAILVEKDWCAFGHQFALRCGHGNDKYFDDENCSPIFVQFIDCVFQLVHQFPSSFEFNQQFLIDLLDEVYGCRTSTFLGNSEMERIISNVNENCVSVWALLLPPHTWGSREYRMHKYVNPLYNEFTDSIRLQHNKTNLRNTKNIHENQCKNILLPDCHQSSIQIWSDYYFRQMKSRMKRIKYAGVNTLSSSVDLKVEHKIKQIVQKADIVSAKNARLRRENDKLRRNLRKMHTLNLKLTEQNDRISYNNNTSSSSVYGDDIDNGYVSVRGRRRSTPPLSSSSVNNSNTKPNRRSSLFNLSFSRWGSSARSNINNNGNYGNGGKSTVRSGNSNFMSHLNGGFKLSR